MYWPCVKVTCAKRNVLFVFLPFTEASIANKHTVGYWETTVITGLLHSLSTADVLKVIDLGLSHKNADMRGTKNTFLTILNANPFIL